MINTNVTRGRVSIWEIAGAAVAKPLIEAAVRPLIGDGTLISGAVKGVGAVLSSEYVGRWNATIGNILGIALGMDCAEDLLNYFGIITKLEAVTKTGGWA